MPDYTVTFTDEQNTLILEYLVAAAASIPFFGIPEVSPVAPDVQDFVDQAIIMAMLSVTNWDANRPEPA